MSSKTVTLQLNVIGDASGGKNAVSQVAGASEAAGGRAKKAFSSALGILNHSGVLTPFQEVLTGLGETFDKVGEKGKSMGEKLAGIGAGAAGLGIMGTMVGSGDKQAMDQLRATVEAAGFSWAQYKDQLEHAAKSQAKYGFTAKDSATALGTLTQATHSPAEATKLLSTAVDLAAAKHMSLNTAAMQLGKTYNGSTRLLKQFGITAGTTVKAATIQLTAATHQATTADTQLAKAKQRLSDLEILDAGKKKLTVAQALALRHAEEGVFVATGNAAAAHKKLAEAQNTAKNAAHGQDDTMKALAGRLHGQAAASVDNFRGRLRVLTAEVENQVASLGQKYGPALTGAGAALSVVGAGMSGAQAIIGKFTGATTAAAGATDTLTASEDAAAVSEGLALGPILLIIAAAALLGVGIYELATHWKTIWSGIKHIVTDVWDWIKHNWPLLLAIITGPIGLAALMVIRHWNTIKQGAVTAFTDVKNFIRTVVGAIVGFFQAMPGRVIGFVTSIPGRISGLAGRFLLAGAHIGGQVFDGLKNAFSDVVGFFTGIGGSIIHAIVQGIESAGSAIGSAISGIISHIPGAGVIKNALHAIHIPGFAFGGTVPGPTGAPMLAVVHGGERIIPTAHAHAAAAGGVTYLTQNITISTKADARDVRDALVSLANKGFKLAG